jgi:hypothetical protein
VADITIVLLAIGIYKPADVRPILQAYHGKDIPLEYAKREAEDKLAHVENWKKKGKSVDVTFSRWFSTSSVSQRIIYIYYCIYEQTLPRHLHPQFLQPIWNKNGKRRKRCI